MRIKEKVIQNKFKSIKLPLEKITSLKSLIILFSFLIRIPRVPYPNGHDSFEVLWVAQAIVNGALQSDYSWLISPFSFLGFYPFSHYPIGTALFLSIFLGIGLGIELSVFLSSMIWYTFGVIGLVKLSEEIFGENKNEQLLFLLSVLIGSNDYYKYTYYTFSPRGILISLSFWYFLYVFRFLKETNKKSFLKLLFLLILMVFFHRLSFIYILTLFFTLIQKIFKKMEKKYNIKVKINSKLSMILLLIALILLYLGYNSFQITTGSIWLIKKTAENFDFFLIISLIINYIIRLGILSIFFPIGFVALCFNGHAINKNIKWFLIMCVYFLCFAWTKQIYTVSLFLPIYNLLSVVGMSQFKRIKSKRVETDKIMLYISLILLVIVFLILIIIFTLIVPFFQTFYIIIIGSLFLLLYFIIAHRNSSKKLQALIIITLILGTSVFSISMQEARDNRLTLTLYPNTLDYPQTRLTDDEKRVIEFIKENGCEGIVFIADERIEIARRIGGYGFLPTLPGDHIVGQQIYYQWLSTEYVKSHSRFDLIHFINHFEFMYFGLNFEEKLYNEVYKLYVSKPEDFYMLRNYNIQYVVAIVGSELTPLVNSLRYIPPDFETSYLQVWKIF